ncbi:MAG: hypothetical protein AABZ47_10170 [Planctomycetota bacterium]
MDQGNHSSASPPLIGPLTDPDMPPGDHPLEVAARRGMGPLSPLGRNVWHGQGTPCVSCGQLVGRDEPTCGHCGQDLSQKMLSRMKAHAGPWYVFEHVRPFPGVSFQRLVRQIRRGVLTETSIIRGPATDHQWRFAVETPGVCLYFGKCWHCHGDAITSATRCAHCGAHLLWDKTTKGAGSLAKSSASPLVTRSVTNESPIRSNPSAPNTTLPVAPFQSAEKKIANTDTMPEEPSEVPSPEWTALRAAVESTHFSARDRPANSDRPASRSVFLWVGVVLLGVVFMTLLAAAQCRERQLNQPRPAAAIESP